MIITKVLLIILFFSLPLIHGGIFATLWFDFKLLVSGNFEFTKSIFFNIFSGLIFLSFFVEWFLQPLSPWRGKNLDRGIAWWFILILIFSTLFSLSPFTSLIWDDNKWHTVLLFFNLLWIFFVLKNLDRKFLYTLLKTSLISWVFVSLIALKELFFPSFNYWHLTDRALGSFGHPNYLAGYLLFLLPCTQYLKNIFQKYWVLFILIIGIILSKSIVAIVLALGYLVYSLTTYSYLHSFSRLNSFNFLFTREMKLQKAPLFWKRGALGWVIVWGVILLALITLYLPEKLHSFLSRFYIWETTLWVITSNWKIFLFWGWPETLSYIFDSFKVPEVYIYENFWFTADRPHNFFLDIFYHFWILWVSIFVYLLYRFYKSFQSNWENRSVSGTQITIILFLLFGIIHFFSIASYLLMVLCIVLISRTTCSPHTIFSLGGEMKQHVQPLSPPKDKWENERSDYLKVKAEQKGFRIEGVILWGLFVLLSLTWAYYSLQFYRAELEYAQRNSPEAQKIFSHPKYLVALWKYEEAAKLEWILSVKNIKTQIKNTTAQKKLCDILVIKYPSAENYLYCWEIFEELWNTKLSQEYYKNWLAYLPDLWNEDSKYWNNYFIKHTITWNRFFSEKFGDIWGVLEKINK